MRTPAAACLARAGDQYHGGPAYNGAPQPMKFNCFGVTGQKAPVGASVDDILGVRPDMTPAAAQKVLGCASPPYEVTEGEANGNFGTPPFPNGTLAKGGFSANRPATAGEPTDKIGVAYVGLPGKEMVAGLSRTMDYPAGKEPNLNDIKNGLIAKYGRPSKADDGLGATVIHWLYSPSGTLLVEGNPSYTDCTLSASDSGSFSVSSECGLTIMASIAHSGDNPSSASRLDLSIINEAKTFATAAADTNYVKSLRASGGATPKF